MGFFLASIQQVLLIIRVIQSLWIPALSLSFTENTKQNLTTSNTKILAQPQHFRKSCEALLSVWNLAEIAPSAYTGLKLAHETRYYTSAAPIFITYAMTNSALDVTDFFSTGRSYYGSCTGNYASNYVPWITFLLKSPAQELSSLSSSLLKLSDFKAPTSTAASFVQYALSTAGTSYFECKKEMHSVLLKYFC